MDGLFRVGGERGLLQLRHTEEFELSAEDPAEKALVYRTLELRMDTILANIRS